MKLFLRILKLLSNPISVGAVITIFITIVSAVYLESRMSSQISLASTFYKSLHVLHLKTIDWRFLDRGPRKGSAQVALVAIDDKSIELEGRWPWPRQKMARLIENAMANEAKILGFDVTFSEPSTHPAKDVYTLLKSTSNVPEEFEISLKKTIHQTDNDQILARSIHKHRNKIILGNIPKKTQHDTYSDYHEICYNWIYETSLDFKLWSHDTAEVGVFDKTDDYISDSISDVYKEFISAYAEAKVSDLYFSNNEKGRIRRQRLMEKEKYNYCNLWLNPDKDIFYEDMKKTWGKIKAEDDEISEPTFLKWVKEKKENYISHQTENYLSHVMNIKKIALSSSHNGFFTTHLDGDGSIRRSPLVIRSGDHFVPSIALKTFLVANNYNVNVEIKPDVRFAEQKRSLSKITITDSDTGDNVFEIPVDSQGYLFINYAGGQHMFPYISATDLLNDKQTAKIRQIIWDTELKKWALQNEVEIKKSEWIKDKVFILGATAIGVFDIRVTPFEENYPGAETHLNVVDNLMRQDFMRPFQNEESILPLFLLALGITLSILLSHSGAVLGFVISTLTVFAIYYIDKTIYFNNGIITTVLFVYIMIFIVYLILTFYKYFTEEQKKRELKGTFSKYVSPAIVNEILKHPENLELGGKKQRMSVFFSDIRDFTAISEKLDPHALTALLNSYLTPMTDLVYQNEGTLDKYMGDAIMAFFGAPVTYKDHAVKACRCALESLKTLDKLQEEFKKQGFPRIDIGIGVNTGDMNVGNMGSQTVRSYTVLGDSVNLGSRLEGINKQYGTKIVISEFTYHDIKGLFTCRELDLVRVKGKNEPVRIYELISEGSPNKLKAQVVDKFKEGYLLYQKREFAKAEPLFAEALSIDPNDGPSMLYSQRSFDYSQHPPRDDWDGVYIMKTK